MEREVVRVRAETLSHFFDEREREALKSFYAFPVVWHDESYGFEVRDGETIVGAGVLRVCASLGHVERIVVDAARRRAGVGSAIASAMADTANYYNCHKMTVAVPHERAAQRFFEACGYSVEAVLPQHTFKLDVAVLRKFLL